MNYGTLQSNVQSAMGRSDVPSYVYDLTTSGLNRDLRLLEMQCVATLYATGEEIDLPANFLEVESAYIDSGGNRSALVPINEMSQATRHDSSGRPYYYAIHKDSMTLMPAPDATYEIEFRYYRRLTALSASTDTNDVLANYPGLYLYAALTHAAVWAQDDEGAQRYNAAFLAEKQLVEAADKTRRNSGPLIQRTIRSLP